MVKKAQTFTTAHRRVIYSCFDINYCSAYAAKHLMFCPIRGSGLLTDSVGDERA